MEVDACHAAFQSALARRVAELERTDDVRSQLALALLGQIAPTGLLPDSERRAFERENERLFASVARQAPDDPLSAWAHAGFCTVDNGCDLAAVTARLQRLEPDNAAAWLLARQLARKRDDPRQAGQLFARAAQASYYDAHWGDVPLFLRDALGAETLPECVAARDAFAGHGIGPAAAPATIGDMGALLASLTWPIPPLSFEHCRTPQLEAGGPALLAQCRAVHRLLADSDTYIARAVGIARMVELSNGTPDSTYWRERMREYAWAREAGGPVLQEEPFTAVWEQGEWSRTVARLQRAGRWPVPDGWLPERPHHRALVTTGRQEG